MPNVKIYVERHLLPRKGETLIANLTALRRMICAELSVQPAACHLAVIGVDGIADQPALNVEISVLQRPDRTRAVIENLCLLIQKWMFDLTDERAAIRITVMSAETYIV
ncbi:MAG: hypothetical protein ACK4NH_13160, partial [Gemmobacter sp.]